MPGEARPDVAFAGQRIRHKVVLALMLSAVLPLLVLAYVLHGFVLPNLDHRDSLRVLGVHFLAFFTVLAMVGGAYIIWDLGRIVARMAQMLASGGAIRNLGVRKDEVGTLLASFSQMLDTIEQQARDINSFAMRLDTAYKELEVANARLKETSFKDDVTGLYNRRFFSLRLDEELSRHRRFNHPVSVVLLDLDGFKAINDGLGHAVGDATLREIGQAIVKHSRGINVVCRWGGDEFAILLVETPRAGARVYAERIRELVAAIPFGHGLPVTASFGVASLPEDAAPSGDEFVRAADEALYAAKRAGRNQVALTTGPVQTNPSAATQQVP